MRLLATTMRELRDPATGEERDGLDRNWSSFLDACGFMPLCLPNSLTAAHALLEHTSPAGVLLTGGGDVAAVSGTVSARDTVEEWLLDWASTKGLPVLGICRGFQKIASMHGGRLDRRRGHVAVSHPLEGHVSRPSVNSFHDHVLSSVPEDFVVKARAPDGTIEWAEHRHKKLAGIMWHPERTAPYSASDLAFFTNWFSE